MSGIHNLKPEGVIKVKGKRDKIRFVPVHAAAQRLIEEYLGPAGRGNDVAGPPFRPVRNSRTAEKLDRPLDPASVYRNIVRKYGLETGISAEVNGLCVHSLRATAATNALSHDSDIAKVQDGSAMRTCPRRGCMIDASRSPRTVRRSG